MIIKVTKDMAMCRLADTSLDKAFWVTDGRILKNLAELGAALAQMTDETYLYHANEGKNDFARWVDEVIGDDKLARDLKKAADRAHAARFVSTRIEWLKAKLA